MLIDKVTEFFVEADDFCQEFEVEIRKHLIASKANGCRLRKSQLSDSEIIRVSFYFFILVSSTISRPFTLNMSVRI